MNSKEQERKVTLDHMIDEKFGEIYFLAKEEFDIEGNSDEEQQLYDLLAKYRAKLKNKCKHHFQAEVEVENESVERYQATQNFFNDTEGY